MGVRNYYLIDVTHNKRNNRAMRALAAISNIAIFHGFCKDFDHIEKWIRNYWNDEWGSPSEFFSSRFRTKNIKWYIHNFVKIEDQVWNSDFIHGLASGGTIHTSRVRWSTLIWHNNKSIEEILSETPFYGTRRWMGVKHLQRRSREF